MASLVEELQQIERHYNEFIGSNLDTEDFVNFGKDLLQRIRAQGRHLADADRREQFAEMARKVNERLFDLTNEYYPARLETLEARSNIGGVAISGGVAGDIIIQNRAPSVVPLQRPPRIEHFVDRRAELARLLDELQPGRVVTLSGPGGVGKSALAAETVWTLAPGDTPPARFPGGIIWHSFYGQPQTDVALENIARSYGEEPLPTPQTAAWRVLAGKRALLVLDGTEEADDLGRVLTVAGSCGVLITSRRRSDARAQRLDIQPLSRNEAVELLKAWGKEQVTDTVTAQLICELVGDLPLAVSLVGRYLEQTGESAANYLKWLKQTPLEVLDQGQRRSESIIRLIERSLAQVGDEAQQVLGIAGNLALAPFTQEVIAAVLPEIRLHQALGELVKYNLLRHFKSEVEIKSQNLYEVSHPLIHIYAQKRLTGDADYILGRLVAYYFALSREQSQLGLHGYARLDIERPHILRLIALSIAQELFDEAQDLVWAVDTYLEARSHFAERLLSLKMGLEAAQKVNNLYTQAAFLGSIGSVFRDLGQFEQAVEHYQRALITISPVGDKRGEAAILGNLGLVYRDLGQVDQAIVYYQQALAITREVGDKWGEGNHLGNLGLAYHDLGQTKQAIEYYQQALVIAREISDRRGEAVTLGNLGLAYHDLGEVDQAIDYLQQSLSINQELLGLEHPETVQILNNLGFLLRAKGDYKGSLPYIEQALAIRERVLGQEHPDTAQSLTNLGFLLDRMGHYEHARPYFERALSINEKVWGQEHLDTATSLNNLGALLISMGDYTNARPYLERALAIREKLLGADHPDTATTLYTLGFLLERMEDYEMGVTKMSWKKEVSLIK